MLRLKLEGKQTDIIREFKLVDNPNNWILDNAQYYEENKIILDKQGNVTKEKIIGQMSNYRYDKYKYKLEKQGYQEI